MNGKEKTKYLLQYHRANRKFEAKHLPRVEKALKGVVRSLIGDIREKGIWSAMTNLSTQLWSDELTKPLLGLYKEVGLFHAKTTYRTIKSEIGQKQLGRSEQWVQDVIRILRETLLQFAVVGTSETLRNHLLLVLQQGVDKGLSVDEMVKMLEGSDFTEMQARRIIRTEVGRAANTGVKVAADSFNVEMQKEWFAFRDQRTRGVKPKDKKDHYHMDGQVVDYNADFVDPRSGERIEFPQAPGGSAAMVINCRCTWAAIPKRDERGMLIGKSTFTKYEKKEIEPVTFDIESIKADIKETIQTSVGMDREFVENLVKTEVAKLNNKSEIEGVKETFESQLKESINVATESIQTSFHAFNRVNEVAIKQGDQTIEGKVNELAEVVKQIEVSPVVEVNTDSAEVISEIRDMRTDLVAGFMDLKMAINEKGNFEIQFERDANGFLKSPIKVIRK
jgi:hypothetical protein